jgi:hypothetical protein
VTHRSDESPDPVHYMQEARCLCGRSCTLLCVRTCLRQLLDVEDGPGRFLKRRKLGGVTPSARKACFMPAI